MYFVFGLIFWAAAYSSYKIDNANPMDKPLWAWGIKGKLFFVLNSLLSGLVFIGISIYGIMEVGVFVVILCTVLIFPIVIHIFRLFIHDILISFFSIPAFIILLVIMVT